MLEHNYLPLVTAVTDKVFGFSMFNLFRNNIIALKERFLINHDNSGIHIPTEIGWKGPAAYAQYKAGTGIVDSFNVTSVTNPSTGTYTFNLTNAVGTNPTVLTTTYLALSTTTRLTKVGTVTTTTVQVVMYGNATTLSNLFVGDSVCMALYETYP